MSDDAFGIVTFVGAAICLVVFVADELEGKYCVSLEFSTHNLMHLRHRGL